MLDTVAATHIVSSEPLTVQIESPRYDSPLASIAVLLALLRRLPWHCKHGALLLLAAAWLQRGTAAPLASAAGGLLLQLLRVLLSIGTWHAIICYVKKPELQHIA